MMCEFYRNKTFKKLCDKNKMDHNIAIEENEKLALTLR